MGYQTTADGTQIVAGPEWVFGQLALSRIDDGTVAMNRDGSPSTPTVLWNGTGGGDTGGDWSRSGVGSESTAAAYSGTNGLNTTITSEDDESIFDNGSMVDIAGTYTLLQFWIRAKKFPTGSEPLIFWRNSADATVGLQLKLTNYVEDFDDDWQRIAIPISDFGLGANAQKLVFKYTETAGQRYFIDDIEIYSEGGPYIFQAKAPVGAVYHLKDMILTFAEENGTWGSSGFASISGGLSRGLLLRQRALTTGEVAWQINLKRNLVMFGRLDVLNDVSYTDSHQFTLALNPAPAVINVTDDQVVEAVLRDDLSSINAMRSYIRFGRES